MKTKYITLAKIGFPDPKPIMPRQRLFDLLMEKKKYPVVLVSAPAGSGKTSLVSSFLKKKNIPSIWYQMDREDGDLASFFATMRVAVAKIADKNAVLPPLFTPEFSSDINRFTQYYFEQLTGAINKPFAIVLDNYQDIPNDSELHNVLAAALLSLPEGVNVFIVSRNNLPSEYAKLKISNKVGLIGWEDIKFSFKESTDFLNIKHKDISDRIRESIYDQSEGWIAGIIFMGEQARYDPLFDIKGINESNQEDVFNYFAHEIFIKADKDIQDFLLQSVFFPTLIPSMLFQLTGKTDIQELLVLLNKKNYFISKHNSDKPYYQYHQLFRQFLINKAKTAIPEDKLLDIKRRTAMILQDNGQPQASIELFLELEEWRSVIRLINDNALKLLEQGQNKTIETWIYSIPSAIMEKEGWLYYWLGICRIPYEPLKAREYLNKAMSLLDKDNDPAGVFLSWIGISETIFLFNPKDPSEGTIYLQELIKLKEKYHGEIPDTIKPSLAVSVFSLHIISDITYPDIMRLADETYEVILNSDDMKLSFKAAYILIFYYLWVGEHYNDRLKIIINILKDEAGKETLLVHKAFVKYVESAYYWNIMEYELCIGCINEIEKISSITGLRYFNMINLGNMINNSLSIDDRDRAKQFLIAMSKMINPYDAYNRSYFYYLSSSVSLRDSALDEALAQAENALILIKKCKSEFAEAHVEIMLGNILNKLGRYESALTHLMRGDDIGKSIRSSIVLFNYLLSRAQLEFDHEQEQEGIKYLRQAMELGKLKGYINFLGSIHDMIKNLCLKALEYNIESEYARFLIMKYSLKPPSSKYYTNSWPYQIKIYTLGDFLIQINEKPVMFDGKMQQRPLDMLKIIISKGLVDVPVKDITDIMWPESDGDIAYRVFITTLQRLRKLLGDNRFVILKENKVSLDTTYIWVDSYAFMQMMQLSKMMKDDGQTTKACDICLKAILLYKGDFLPYDNDQGWTIRLRENLRADFIHHAKQAGAILEDKKQWERVIQIYHDILAIDPYAEDIYLDLMRVYSVLKQDDDAIRAYNRCKTMLKSQNTEPSKRLSLLYDELRSRKARI